MIRSTSFLASTVFALSSVFVIGVTEVADARTQAQCDAYARNYASQNLDTPGNPVSGGIVGGTVGSLIGWATGSWATGAVIGGSVGSVDRAFAGNRRYQQLYNHAYNWCIRN